jgi:hypothetical protein
MSNTYVITETRPQTLAYALTDSPVGQLAWIVEKYTEWSTRSAAVPEEAFDMQQLLLLVHALGCLGGAVHLRSRTR